MDDWRESYLALFRDAETEEQIIVELEKIIKSLGFDRFSYGIKIPFPVTRPKYFLYSSYPSSWEEKYVKDYYFEIDPIVKKGLSIEWPLVWQADPSEEESDFWEEAMSYQIKHGWSFSVKGPSGTHAMLSVVRSHEILTLAELDSKEMKLIWLTNIVSSSISKLAIPRFIPESTSELTVREKEVLRWTAIGKTYDEISLILNIDSRTVKFHLVNSMRKLNAANKAEASVKASLLGLLY